VRDFASERGRHEQVEFEAHHQGRHGETGKGFESIVVGRRGVLLSEHTASGVAVRVSGGQCPLEIPLRPSVIVESGRREQVQRARHGLHLAREVGSRSQHLEGGVEQGAPHNVLPSKGSQQRQAV